MTSLNNGLPFISQINHFLPKLVLALVSSSIFTHHEKKKCVEVEISEARIKYFIIAFPVPNTCHKTMTAATETASVQGLRNRQSSLGSGTTPVAEAGHLQVN